MMTFLPSYAVSSTPAPSHSAVAKGARRKSDRERKRLARAAAREAGEIEPRLVDAAITEALVTYAGQAGLHGEKVNPAVLHGVTIRVSGLVVQAGRILCRRRGCTSAEATRALLARLSPNRLHSKT